MQIVKNRELYHINSLSSINPYELLNIGDVIKTDNYNPFRNSYETGVASIEAYWRFTKELAIEQTRIQVNERLPSRWNCLWLSDMEHLPYWKKECNDNHQIVRMSLNGKLFSCDAFWVEMQPSPLARVREYANHYWNGEIFRPGKKEYLFEGTAEVIEIME